MYISCNSIESKDDYHRARPTLAVPIALAPASFTRNMRAITIIVHNTARCMMCQDRVPLRRYNAYTVVDKLVILQGPSQPDMYQNSREIWPWYLFSLATVDPGTRWFSIASCTSHASSVKSMESLKGWVLSVKALGRVGNWPITGPSEMREPKDLKRIYHKGLGRHRMLLCVCRSIIALTDCWRKQQALQVQIGMLKQYVVRLHSHSRRPNSMIDGL